MVVVVGRRSESTAIHARQTDGTAPARSVQFRSGWGPHETTQTQSCISVFLLEYHRRRVVVVAVVACIEECVCLCMCLCCTIIACLFCRFCTFRVAALSARRLTAKKYASHFRLQQTSHSHTHPGTQAHGLTHTHTPNICVKISSAWTPICRFVKCLYTS